MAGEKRFLFEHIARYLGRKPAPGEVSSVWSGQRPLVRQPSKSSTAAISRDHTILISSSGLVTVTGGKWTTYRRMGEDAVNRAAALVGLREVRSRTADLKLHGWSIEGNGLDQWENSYGADLPALREIMRDDPPLGDRLHSDLPFRKAEVIWAARFEMARTVEDVLARRTRALFLDARAAIAVAGETARLLAQELARDEAWQRRQEQDFRKLAEGYCL